MKCQECGKPTYVVQTRRKGIEVERVRRCTECHHRVRTMERIEKRLEKYPSRGKKNLDPWSPKR